MEAFFADGGTTNFIDRLTGSLGIHASNVKIVSVYEGSLIINYEISADDDEDTDALAAIQEKQDEMLSSGSIDLGAPVLSFKATVSLDASSSSTYTPVTIVAPTYDQVNINDPNVFNPNMKIITEQQVSYKNNSIKIELDPEMVIKSETVIIDTTPETKIVSIQGEKDMKGFIIVAAALAVIAIILIFFFIRKMVLKPFEERI